MSSLFVAEEWDRVRDPVCAINHQLAGFIKTDNPIIGKPYCMVLRASQRQTENAQSMKVKLVLPSEVPDAEDNGKHPSPEWFLSPKTYFKSLSTVPPVKILIGHFPVSCKAVFALKENLYPKAKVVLVNHTVTWTVEEHLKYAEKADVVFSVGPKVFGHYANIYRGIRHHIDHHLFLPRPEQSFFLSKVDICEQPQSMEQILRATGRGNVPSKFNQMIISAVGVALTKHEEIEETFPIWRLRNTSAPANYKLVKDVLTRHPYTCSPYGCQEVSAGVLQTFICVVPPEEPLGMRGLEAIATGLPVLIPKGSNLEAFLRSRFGEHLDYFLYDSANSNPESLQHQLTKILRDPVNATTRAKALRESFEKDTHIAETHDKIKEHITYRNLSKIVSVTLPSRASTTSTSRSSEAGSRANTNQIQVSVDEMAQGAAMTDDSDSHSEIVSSDSNVDLESPSAKRLKQTPSTQADGTAKSDGKNVNTQQSTSRQTAGTSGQQPSSNKVATVNNAASKASTAGNKRRAPEPPRQFMSKLKRKGDRYPSVLLTASLKFELKKGASDGQTKTKKLKLATRRRIQKKVEEIYDTIIRHFHKNKNPDVIQKLYDAFDSINTVIDPAHHSNKSKLELLLTFRSDTDIDLFGFRHEVDGIADMLTPILVTEEMTAIAAKAGYTVRIKVDIDPKEYETVQEIMRDISIPPDLPFRPWYRTTYYDKFEDHLLERTRDYNHGRFLIDQVRYDLPMGTLRGEEFFHAFLVPYWYENSYQIPPSLTKATEAALEYHLKKFCKQREIDEENATQTLTERLRETGQHLYENMTKHSAGRLDVSWLAKKVPDVELHLYGLVKESETGYSFLSRFLYMYAVALYFSHAVESSEESLLELKDKSAFEICRNSLPHCFAYVCGLLGEKSGPFLEAVASAIAADTPMRYEKLEILGCCLFETKCPKDFAKSLENILGHVTLDLYRTEEIPHPLLYAFTVILNHTAIIQDVAYYSQRDKGHLSEEFIAYIEANKPNSRKTETYEFKISNSREFSVMCKFLRFIPLTHYLNNDSPDYLRGYHSPQAKFLTIEGTNPLTNIKSSTMELFMCVLSYMPSQKTMTLKSLGPKFCREFFLALADRKNKVNVYTRRLLLPNNDLSFKECGPLLAALRLLHSLKELDISKNKLGNAGCAALLPLKRDITLVVDDNGIGGLEDILPFINKDLEFKIRSVIKVSNEKDFEKIQHRLKYVTELDMQDISDELCEKVCDCLPFFTHLGRINFSNRQIKRDVIWLACESINLMRHLKRLELNNCSFPVDTLSHILKSIRPWLKHLSLLGTGAKGEIAESLQHLTKLEDLDLSYNKLTDTDVASITKFVNPALTHLRLSHNEITNCVEDFSHLKQLSLLDLSHNKLQCHLKDLVGNISSTVTCLDVSHNVIENVEQVGRLVTDFQEVQIVNLSHNAFGAVGVQSLLSQTADSQIQSKVDVSHNLASIANIIPYDKEQVLKSMEPNNLEGDEIKLSHNNLEALFKKLDAVTVLEIPSEATLSDAEFKGVCRDIAVLTNLKVLKLSGQIMGTDAVKALSRSFQNLKSLSIIDFSHNNIGDQAAEIFSEAISYTDQLSQLDVSHNVIGDRGLGYLLTGGAPSGGESQTGLAKHCRDLSRLDLSHNAISDASTEIICQLLTESQHLTHIDLSHNQISEHGARKLLDAVSCRKSSQGLKPIDYVDFTQDLIKDEELVKQMRQPYTSREVS